MSDDSIEVSRSDKEWLDEICVDSFIRAGLSV